MNKQLKFRIKSSSVSKEKLLSISKLWLCAKPPSPLLKFSIYNCGPVLTVEAQNVICQNWCACVPSSRDRF